MKPLNKMRVDGHMIAYYTCGCKSCQSGKLKKLIFGVGYNQESQTIRLLNEIAAGDYGLEWKELLEKNPTGSIDICAELYICRSCGYWVNDYNLSFYVLPTQYSTKRKSVYSLEGYSEEKCKDVIKGIKESKDKYQNYYQLYKEYPHKCQKCSNIMERIPLKKDCWFDESKLQQLGLKCPLCKEIIQITKLKNI